MLNKIKYDVAVVGLGYVGLTLAVTLANVGFTVLGIEKQQQLTCLINSGKAHFQEKNLDHILKDVLSKNKLIVNNSFSDNCYCSTYIITVGTPLDINGNSCIKYIIKAAQQVANNMQNGALVILRSTVKIGTTRDIIKPILLNTNKSFQIAFCPERTIEGQALQELRELPQIIGTDDTVTFKRVEDFFSKVTKTVLHVQPLESAEIIKLVDNSYRDVFFGFANEVTRICNAFGVDANEVINKGKYNYLRTNVAMPGLVGGPCLEKDPHIFVQSAIEKGITLEIIKAARVVNERQPQETVAFIANKLKDYLQPEITVWGIAFKGNPETNDLRGSMSVKVIEQLLTQIPAAKIKIYDAVCSTTSLKKINNKIVVANNKNESLCNSNCLIIANNHTEFSQINLEETIGLLSKNSFIYDYWNHFADKKLNNSIKAKYFALANSMVGV